VIKAGVVVLAVLAVLWATRLEVVHLHRAEFIVLNRLTGAIRYCDPSGCFPVEDAPAHRTTYDDLIHKK